MPATAPQQGTNDDLDALFGGIPSSTTQPAATPTQSTAAGTDDDLDALFGGTPTPKPQTPGYLDRVMGAQKALSKAVDDAGGVRIKDILDVPAEAIASTGTGMIAPILAMNEQAGQGILHLATGSPIENYSTIKDRYTYQPTNPVAVAAGNVVSALTSPVGDAIKAGVSKVTSDPEKQQQITDAAQTALGVAGLKEGPVVTDAVNNVVGKTTEHVTPIVSDTIRHFAPAAIGGTVGGYLAGPEGIAPGGYIVDKLFDKVGEAIAKRKALATDAAASKDFAENAEAEAKAAAEERRNSAQFNRPPDEPPSGPGSPPPTGPQSPPPSPAAPAARSFDFSTGAANEPVAHPTSGMTTEEIMEADPYNLKKYYQDLHYEPGIHGGMVDQIVPFGEYFSNKAPTIPKTATRETASGLTPENAPRFEFDAGVNDAHPAIDDEVYGKPVPTHVPGLGEVNTYDLPGDYTAEDEVYGRGVPTHVPGIGDAMTYDMPTDYMERPTSGFGSMGGQKSALYRSGAIDPVTGQYTDAAKQALYEKYLRTQGMTGPSFDRAAILAHFKAQLKAMDLDKE